VRRLKDNFNRKIDYLRISVTDKCNLRCLYCVPQKGVKTLPRSEVLTFEEIVLIARAAVKAGIRKIRLTGGEPLVRKDIVELVRILAGLKGLKDLSLTTNGIHLESLARKLFEAGLKRINISLDTLDPERYREITGGGDLSQVLAGIDEALEVGFDPVKINSVLIDGGVKAELERFLDLVFRKPVHVRFIEKMEFDEDCGSAGKLDCGQLEKVILSLVEAEETKGPLGYGPARYIKPKGAKGTIGFICPYSRHFCPECNRLRITADGKLRPCLFSDAEVDLKRVIREKAGSEKEIIEKIREALGLKPESFKTAVKLKKRSMRQIGG
jgi:cyclic pyranopterin phosphate synthase